MHKREAAARASSKPQGRAGGDSHLAQSSGVDSGEAGLRAELAATSKKLAAAQREAMELSTSLAKASSLIEVSSPITRLQQQVWVPQEPNLQNKLAPCQDLLCAWGGRCRNM